MEFYIIFLPGLVYILLGIALLINYMKRRYFVCKWLQNPDIQNAYFYYLNTSIKDDLSVIKKKNFKSSQIREINNLLNRIAGHNLISFWAAFLITFIVLTIFTYLTFSHFIPGYLFTINSQLNKFINTIPSPVFFAAIGAYFWGFYEFLIRFRNQNWSSVAQHMIWLKIPISMIVCYFIFADSSNQISNVLAFGIGAFPIEALRKYVISSTAPKIGYQNAYIINSPSWESIKGITSQVVEKFEEYDIENAHQLASADPFKLHFNTNIEFVSILDFIDQALLIAYLGADNTKNLNSLGITGAIDFANILYQHDNSFLNEITKSVNFSITNNNEILQADVILKSLMKTVLEDSRVQLIWQLWNISLNHQEANI
jgi:hypothetical protein